MQDDVYPTPDDTAIVMYTSGSTGTPKVFIFVSVLLAVFVVKVNHKKTLEYIILCINLIRESF